MAYCSRYGHQPLSELRQLTARELHFYSSALVDLINAEPPPFGYTKE